MKLQPTPAQAMALLASGLLEADAFPDVAAQWLADGMDSEAFAYLQAPTERILTTSATCGQQPYRNWTFNPFPSKTGGH